jgi:hypothetical protein
MLKTKRKESVFVELIVHPMMDQSPVMQRAAQLAKANLVEHNERKQTWMINDWF